MISRASTRDAIPFPRAPRHRPQSNIKPLDWGPAREQPGAHFVVAKCDPGSSYDCSDKIARPMESSLHSCYYKSTGIEMNTLAIKSSIFNSMKASNSSRRSTSIQLRSSTLVFGTLVCSRSLRPAKLPTRNRLANQNPRLSGASKRAPVVNQCTTHVALAQIPVDLSATRSPRFLSRKQNINGKKARPVKSSTFGRISSATRSITLLQFTKGPHRLCHCFLNRSDPIRSAKYQDSGVSEKTGQMSGRTIEPAGPLKPIPPCTVIEIPTEDATFELCADLEISELATTSVKGAAAERVKSLLRESKSVQLFRGVGVPLLPYPVKIFQLVTSATRHTCHLRYAARDTDPESKVPLTKC